MDKRIPDDHLSSILEGMDLSTTPYLVIALALDLRDARQKLKESEARFSAYSNQGATSRE
jgi:hypothetical protein